MHKTRLLCLLALTVACAQPERPVSPGAPALNPINPNIDLVGAADLIVREDVLASQWLVRDENLGAVCSVIEGGVTPGLRRLLRFTVMTPNVGDADIYIGDPNETFENGQSDLFEFADCHRHFHFKNYATYELIDPATGKVWRAAKRGFCMLDTDPNPAYLGEPARDKNFFSCGAIGIPGNQGISHGWADTYRFFLGGQYFVLDGGGQQPVPPGTYIIRITVNPGFAAKKNQACPAKDPNGLCHNFAEGNYANNVGQVFVTIPAHPGRQGHGPLAGDNSKTQEIEHEGQ